MVKQQIDWIIGNTSSSAQIKGAESVLGAHPRANHGKNVGKNELVFTASFLCTRENSKPFTCIYHGIPIKN